MIFPTMLRLGFATLPAIESATDTLQESAGTPSLSAEATQAELPKREAVRSVLKDSDNFIQV